MGAHWRSCAGGALLVGLASGLNSPGQLHLASAGKYLILNYAGTNYKIALLNS